MEDKIIAMVKEQLGLKDVKLNNKLVDELNMDELDRIELTMFLEEEFRLEIADEDSDKWNIVEDIVKFIEKEVQDK